MLTARFRNIVLFVFVKYVVFAIVLAGMNDRFKTLVTDRSNTTADWVTNTFHYCMYVLLVIIVFIALFSLPYWLVFRIRNKVLFVLAVVLVLSVDSACYVWFNVTGNVRYGEIDLLVGVLTLLVFFFKPVRQKIIAHP